MGVATDSTVKKSRNITRKLYEQVSKTCSWWYPKYTPPGYNWKPKSQKGNVNPNISMPLGNASRTANILEHKTPRCSTVSNTQLVEIILFIIDSKCSKHMTRNLKLLTNFVEKFMGTVKFGNDQIAPIFGYRDLVQGAITIKRVYYVEGLNHNLFSVGQFCDADLEVAFRKSICYIHDLKGNDLLTGSRGINLYSITLQDSTTPNPICLMAKATSSQAWLWHRRLSHLNFDTINLLSKNNIVNGLPKLKFIKDHLCSSCELGKAKKKQFVTTPGNAKALWDRLKELFHDNKDARAINLDNELWSIKIGKITVNEYCTKIRSMADRLINLGCVVSDKNLVIYTINGLDSRFATLVEIIHNRETFPSFENVRTMLLLKESSFTNDSGSSTDFSSSSSSPTVLLASN
ncbi:retrovirus-related pol polyprotein from transposon TNT 1-94 [Tanacetum coccineum]